MTKRDLVDKISETGGFSLKDSYDIVDSVLGLLKNTLVEGEDIKIHGFGNFVLREKAVRRGRNPQTGEAIEIPAKRILTFKPSRLLRDAINGEGE